MAEAMTVETILEAYWQLRGFWTRTRFSIPGPKHGYSDVDLLAYEPVKKHLVIGESKAHGPKTTVFAYTNDTANKDPGNQKALKDSYWDFVKKIPRICKTGAVFKEDAKFGDMVCILTVQLVSNYYLSPDIKKSVLDSIRESISKDLPKGMDIRVDSMTAIDVFADLIVEIGKSPQGKRYGHPVLDLAREFYRYSHAHVEGAGSKKAKLEVKEALMKEFLNSIKSE